MRSRSSGSVILVLVVAALGVACSKRAAPKPKTKEEVLSLFEKHKATHIRCEKLLRAEQALLPVATASVAAMPSASAPAAPSGSALPASSTKPARRAPAAVASALGSARAEPAAAPSAAPNAAASSAPGAAPSAATSAPSARIGEAQACQEGFFRTLKEELGPFDQATMDQWYAEWRKGVKVE